MTTATKTAATKTAAIAPSPCCGAEAALPYRVNGGLATLGPEMIALREAIDRRFLAWAAEIGADSMLFPPLMRAADLSRFDYFRNFPHLAVVASRLRAGETTEKYTSDGACDAIPATDLTDGRYVMPSAACYNIYLHLENTALQKAAYVTTVATCYRNESHYDELQRLWSFNMREIVCIGSSDDVKKHLEAFKERILRFSAELELNLDVQFATDPFYQPQSSTARMQKLFPQKEELLYGGSLAIGSLNFHRNFFGERCNIRSADGEAAFTGCVAFGLERWLHALLDRHDRNIDAALAAVAV